MITLPPCFNPCTTFSVMWCDLGIEVTPWKNTHRPNCAADQSDLTSALLLRFGWKACGRGYLRILILSKENEKKNQMKLLENLSFESLGEALSTEDCIDGRIDAKLESYRFVAN